VKAAEETLSTSTPSNATSERILKALNRPIPRIRVSLFYRIAVVVLAFFMLLLPLIYLGLIGCVCYAVYYHAMHHAHWVQSGIHGFVGLRLMILRVIAYVAPFGMGPLLIVFMLKPLLARRILEEDPLTLDRSQEPVLFAFVDRLCEVIGSPRPTRIDVSCEVNAGARIGRFWKNRELILMIGLPLVAGLKLREFACILAHEFGHLAQGGATRLWTIAGRINDWFARVVYERDQWDQVLITWARDTDLRVGIVLHLTRSLVWLSRRILWVLMQMGRAASCLMSRQMEHDADRYSAALVGVDAFETTQRRIRELGVAWLMADRDLQLSWTERRLADNLPMLVCIKSRMLSDDDCQAAELEMAGRRQRLFATHPTNAARINHVKRYATPGGFDVAGPATALFSSFKMIAHAVTLAYYRRVIGLRVEKANLVPTERLLAEQKALWDEQRVQRRYFQNCLTACAPLWPGMSRIGRPPHAKETASNLRVARRQFVDFARQYEKAGNDTAEVEGAIARAMLLLTFVRAGAQASLRGSELPETTRADAQAALSQTVAQRAQLAKSLDRFEKTAVFRLVAALQLARLPAVAARIDSVAESLAKTNAILAALDALEAVWPLRMELERTEPSLAAAMQMRAAAEKKEEDTRLFEAVVQSLAEQMCMQIEDMRSRLNVVAYPFEHAAGRISLSKFACTQSPMPNKPQTVLRAARQMTENLQLFYLRSMGRLALLAEQVEAVLGMPPLRDPEGGGDAAA